MSNKKPKGNSRESYFANYKSSKKYDANRLKKLLRLQKEQPNNQQIAKALDNIHYRRDTPKTEVWSHSMISDAKIFKYFTGKFNRGIYSTIPGTESAALRDRNENIFEHYKAPSLNQNSMYSLKERAHSSNGMRVWI
jgi:hypothetical protein